MDSLMAKSWIILLLVLFIHQCVGPPTKTDRETNNTITEEKKEEGIPIDPLDIEYNRYLAEVIQALESDDEFKKKMENAKEADFRSGKIALELEYVSHHVRTKLDELKRTELQRLKDLVKQADSLKKKPADNHANPGHLDHSNPHTFEIADLQKLIFKVRKDLEEADRKRRENFKEYELQKEFEKEMKLKTMDEEHQKAYLNKLEEQKKKHQEHDPIHHPGSKAQLEEVWEKTDHMENQQFNPKAFFYIHDIDGNGYWDEQEVNALFLKELDKLYQAGMPEDDLREREEEMERMREHVFKEADTNHDRLISYEEFLEQTKKREFQEDEGWETIDQKPQFTHEEYLEFEKRRKAEIQDLINRGVLPAHPPGMPPVAYYPQQVHPQQMQGQQFHPPPGAVPQYSNQQFVNNYPQGTNQMGQQHPPQYNQMPPQYPSQNIQHPNQVPPHPQVPQYAQVPQHPNQAPQFGNQNPQQHINQQFPQHQKQDQGLQYQIPQQPQIVQQQVPISQQQPQAPQQQQQHGQGRVDQNYLNSPNVKQVNQQANQNVISHQPISKEQIVDNKAPLKQAMPINSVHSQYQPHSKVNLNSKN